MLLPKPYPDEILGSVLARASYQLGLPAKTLMACVFPQSRAIPFLMSGELQAIAIRCGVDAEELLYRHTVFPYAVAYMSAEATRKLRDQALASAGGNSSLNALAKNVSHGVPARRICPQCVTEDMARFGETYWHRSHLLPGVVSCAKHGATLRLTDVPMVGVAPRNETRLPFEVATVSARFSRPLETYSKVAEVAVGLLEAPAPSPEELLSQYRARALKLGYVMKSGDVACRVLSARVRSHFGDDYLQAAGAGFDPANHFAWPTLMVRPGTSVPFAPVKHVLLQSFLASELPAVEVPPPRPGPKPRDYARWDTRAADRLRNRHRQLVVIGERRTAKELLTEIDLWSTYRHVREYFPKTAAFLKDFRQSDQSTRQVGRRSYWRVRLGLAGPAEGNANQTRAESQHAKHRRRSKG